MKIEHKQFKDFVDIIEYNLQLAQDEVQELKKWLKEQ